ncbi:hypothetical protein A9Q76_07895 [Arcobacter sp. 31_11_sub10_T18]|nr:hypothetical protein A9Q76_07895 [Arcobacter sp. 31_11_sub10_T18]
MILNTSKIKTEALLLFCKDIILSYQKEEDAFFNVNDEVRNYVTDVTNDFLTQLLITTKPNDYYLKQSNNSKVKAILEAYNFLNKSLSQELQDRKTFNPSMLYLSLMATWFAELSKESKSKEFIYFSMYPYADIYDKLLINVKDTNFKALNISMIDISETIIFKLNNYKFT